MSRSNPIPWLALLSALAGLAWCGYIAFPTAHTEPCATSGCALFQDTRIAGISLWLVGGAYFFTLAIICLRGNRKLGRQLAWIGLFLDAILLLIMFVTAPCADCLVVAAFIGLCYFNLRPLPQGGIFHEEGRVSILLPIWVGLFIGNALMAVEEQTPRYALGRPEVTALRVYFAPSCPACRDALVALGDRAALYPVEEKEGDFESVLKLAALLERGVPMKDALTRSIDANEPLPSVSAFTRMQIKMQMMRNKSSVLRRGYRALPLIEINGLPGSLSQAATQNTPVRPAPPVQSPPRAVERPSAPEPAQPDTDIPALPEQQPIPANPAPSSSTTGGSLMQTSPAAQSGTTTRYPSPASEPAVQDQSQTGGMTPLQRPRPVAVPRQDPTSSSTQQTQTAPAQTQRRPAARPVEQPNASGNAPEARAPRQQAQPADAPAAPRQQRATPQRGAAPNRNAYQAPQSTYPAPAQQPRTYYNGQSGLPDIRNKNARQDTGSLEFLDPNDLRQCGGANTAPCD